MLWTRPTGLVVLLVAVVTLLVIAGVRMLAAVGRRADTGPPEIAQGSDGPSADAQPAVDLRESTAEADEAEPAEATADS